MTNILQDAATMLGEIMAEHNSVPIIYTRGSAIVAIDATRGRTPLESDSDDGGITRYETADYIFAKSKLILNGSPTEPQQGDTITEDGKTYTVIALPGLQPWNYSDQHRILIRVHTKQTA